MVFVGERGNVRSLGGALRGGDELDLHAVDTVDAVDEEDEDEHEADLHVVLNLGDNGTLRDEATPTVSRRPKHRAQGRIRRVRSHMKIFRLMLKGSGRMSSMNMPISAIRRTNTCAFTRQPSPSREGGR